MGSGVSLKRIDEWVFRFNRRHSRSRALLFRRLLQQAVEGDALQMSGYWLDNRTPGTTPPLRESC